MQQESSIAKSSRRFVFNRLSGIAAIIFIAAVVISAVPSFGASAQGGSFFGLGSVFGSNETKPERQSINSQSVAQPFLFAPGTCDTAGPIEVESSGGTTAPTAYTTLLSAFSAINNGTHTGTITIDVCGDTTETAPAVINASGSGSASYTSIAISPIGARSISGAIAGGSPLIDFNGADNVTINGLNAGGNSLTISNTTVSSSSFTNTIRFINDATNNTVQNASILGSSTATTNCGVIFFAGTNGTSGNDGNIINNNNIGPAGSNLPTNAICSLGTTTTGTHYNSGIQITGNRIFDFFNASTASNGIFASTGSSDWTITGNSFYQTATRTATAGSTHTAIQVNYSLANNFVISNNTIGGSDATAGGTPWTQAGSFASRFVGIQFTGGSTTPSSIQNNTIKNFAWTSTSGTTTLPGIWIGIYVSTGSANVGTTTGNTIGATTGTGSVTVSTSTSGGISFGIGSVSTGTVAISNNNVGSITLNSTLATVSHPFVGIQTTNGTNTISGNIIGSSTTANSINATPASTSATAQSVTGILSSSSTSANISNNIIANLNNNYAGTSTGAQVRGIVGTAGVLTITSNTVRNLSTSATSTGTNSLGSVIGISISPASTNNNTISQNLVHSLSNSAASAGVQLTGIYVAPSGSAGNVIERNLVYNISTPSTGSASINGIYAFNGNSTYRNNMVRLGFDAAGNSLTSGNLAINGILADTISASTNNYYHNSVYVGGTGVGAGTTATSAFRRVTSDTSNVFNNIFVNNRSNGAGTGRHYIMSIAATTTFNSNTNLFYQNGTGGVFGIVGSTESVTFDNWKTNTGKDLNSIFGDPLFVAPTAATPDLHIQAGSPAIDQAANVGVTNDFDGQIRPGANASFDIGADETDGITPAATDIKATAFIVPTSVGTKLAGVTFSPQASFTNNGTSAQTNVTVRYRICTDASCATEIYNQTATIASIAPGATVTVTFPSTSIASPGTYTIKARAELGTDTVPANDEITGTVIVPAPFSGTYTVGSGGTYSSLTNNGGIFQAINTIGASGTVTIEITSNLSGETGTHALNAISGGASVVIKPQTSVSPTITGLSAGCLINLSGADNVTIDGSNAVNGTGRNMTITNTSSGTSSAVVCLQTSTTGGLGATNNTVKNTNIVGNSSTTTLFGIFSGGSTISLSSTGTDNDNNTIQNNAVSKTQYGIFSQGASAANKNQGTTI